MCSFLVLQELRTAGINFTAPCKLAATQKKNKMQKRKKNEYPGQLDTTIREREREREEG